ncbi:10562_t:CDS:2 [Entrophospora sp. SA101]|nr:10562_t:CDS:2 [Entrophospora sp. SA101]CAJ0831990.1 2708_t:CDS:2 [Entrophospora sp. SA101]
MLKKEPEFIPSPDSLKNWLQQPPDSPIKVTPAIYDSCFRSKVNPNFLNKIFVSSPNASIKLWIEFINGIVTLLQPSFTEDSYHPLWQQAIYIPIKLGCPDGAYNRNSSYNTSTRQLHPDFSFLVSNACLFRGEEKAPSNAEDPANELTSKLIWIYGECPYIFGYYAVGFMVTFCYLQKGRDSIERIDLKTCNLEKLDGRIEAFLIGRNIGHLLPLLRKTIPDSLQEFTIIHRDNGKIIELMQNVVIKRYKSAELVGHIVNLYDKMKSHHISFIDSLIKVKIEEQSVPFVILSPKGIHYKPQSEKQLVMALYCALTAVEAFHGLNIMHRDIRWENLMKYADKDRWFIIDFDEACDSPSSVPYMQLDRRSHAPEIFSGNHDKSVDIWSIGHLILETSIKSELLTEYAERSLMLKDSKKRPTAKEALEWLCNRYKDILQTEFLISKY